MKTRYFTLCVLFYKILNMSSIPCVFRPNLVRYVYSLDVDVRIGLKLLFKSFHKKENIGVRTVERGVEPAMKSFTSIRGTCER